MEDILWQSVVCLPKCTRTAFRRRLVPRQAAPSITETPFPCDCLPLSPSVARSVPPCVEVETYENVDLGIFDALLAPSHRLSNEAWDTIRFRAADAFESLAVLAREEASRLIQQQWHRHAQVRALHAHRSPMSCCSVSASPVPVPPTTPSRVPRRRRRRVVDATLTTPLSAKPTAAVPERHDIVIDSPPLTSAATPCLPSNGSRVRHKVVPPVTPPGRVSRSLCSRRAVLEGRSDTSEPGESSAAADDVDQSHPETCGSSFMTLDNCTFSLDRPLSTPVLQSGESLVADAVPATLRTEHLPPHFRSGSSRPIRGRLRTPRSRNACEDRAPLKLDRGSVLFAASAMLSDRGDGRKPKVGEPPTESDDTLPLFSGSGVALTQDQGRRVRRSKHVPPVVSAMELDLGISLGSSVSTSSTQVNTVKKPRRTKLALESDRPLTSDFARPQSREAPKISARTKAASFGRSLLDMDLRTSSDPSCVRPLSSDDAFRKHLSRKVSSPAASVGFFATVAARFSWKYCVLGKRSRDAADLLSVAKSRRMEARSVQKAAPSVKVDLWRLRSSLSLTILLFRCCGELDRSPPRLSFRTSEASIVGSARCLFHLRYASFYWCVCDLVSAWSVCSCPTHERRTKKRKTCETPLCSQGPGLRRVSVPDWCCAKKLTLSLRMP